MSCVRGITPHYVCPFPPASHSLWNRQAFNRLQCLFNSDPLYKVTSMEKAELWKFRKHCTNWSKALPKFLVSVNWMSTYQVDKLAQMSTTITKGERT